MHAVKTYLRKLCPIIIQTLLKCYSDHSHFRSSYTHPLYTTLTDKFFASRLQFLQVESINYMTNNHIRVSFEQKRKCVDRTHAHKQTKKNPKSIEHLLFFELLYLSFRLSLCPCIRFCISNVQILMVSKNHIFVARAFYSLCPLQEQCIIGQL